MFGEGEDHGAQSFGFFFLACCLFRWSFCGHGSAQETADTLLNNQRFSGRHLVVNCGFLYGSTKENRFYFRRGGLSREGRQTEREF